MGATQETYADAKVVARVVDDLLLVTASGLITLEAQRAMRRRLAEVFQWGGLIGAVIDYRACLHLLSDSEWLLSASAEEQRVAIHAPVALVASPAELQVMRRHGWRLRRAGQARAVFADLEPAIAWVRRPYL